MFTTLIRRLFIPKKFEHPSNETTHRLIVAASLVCTIQLSISIFLHTVGGFLLANIEPNLPEHLLYSTRIGLFLILFMILTAQIHNLRTARKKNSAPHPRHY